MPTWLNSGQGLLTKLHRFLRRLEVGLLVGLLLLMIVVAADQVLARKLVGGGALVVLYFLLTFWFQTKGDRKTRLVAREVLTRRLESADLMSEDIRGKPRSPEQDRYTLSWLMDYYFPRVLGYVTLLSCGIYVFLEKAPTFAAWLAQ